MPPRRKANYVLTAGLPMILLVVGGSLFLTNFTQTRVELKDRVLKSSSEKQFDLEEENRKLLKKLDIENFSLSRIPRPDEEQEGQKKAK
jgi:hypothetical protein|eukprot:gene14547-10397_t